MEKIQVAVDGSEKYGFKNDVFYPVIGCREKSYFRDGKELKDSQFIVINEENKPVGIYIQKCTIRIIA